MGTLQVGTLAGRHVVLERLRMDHVDDITAAASGDRSTFDKTPVPASPESAAAYVQALLADADADRVAPFVQRRTADGIIVGCTRFLDPHWPLERPDPDEVEIGGTWLRANAQRTPINTEAKLLLMTHAFESWGVQRVAICTDALNTRSREAIERLGANLDGVLPKHRRAWLGDRPGALRDTAVYSVIDTDWPTVRAGLWARLAPR